MKVDLHVHTKERSACAKASEEEQIQAAITAGLDAIFVTDHWQLVPEARLSELNHQYAPFRVYGGIEITVEGEDVLVLGVREKALENWNGTYPDLVQFVRQRGGFLVIAHPYRYHPGIPLPLEEFPPDAIEVYSPNTPPTVEGEIRVIANQLGISLLSDSDAHTSQRIGMNYNILDDPSDGEAGLLAALRRGGFELHHQ